MFSLSFGKLSRQIEKIEENTFEIYDTSGGWTSAIVCGDTLINLVTGKEDIINLKFA